MAFRSVPRPSSPPGAKASTERPSLALSHANDEPEFDIPILHRNHPTALLRTVGQSPYPYAANPSPLREQRCQANGRAIKHIHSTHASEHNPVAGTWIALTILLRSDLQPARPDAPNPDSHVKRTKTSPPSRKTSPHPHDHRPATPRSEAPLNAHTICFPTATTFASYGGGRYRTDDPLLAKQVLSH